MYRSCPAGFAYISTSDKCYLYSKSANVTSSTAAESECSRLYGGDAASVHTYRILWFLSYLMMSQTTAWDLFDYGAYVGGIRTSSTAVWTWTDGSAFDYSLWSQFPYVEPNGQLSMTIA